MHVSPKVATSTQHTEFHNNACLSSVVMHACRQIRRQEVYCMARSLQVTEQLEILPLCSPVTLLLKLGGYTQFCWGNSCLMGWNRQCEKTRMVEHSWLKVCTDYLPDFSKGKYLSRIGFAYPISKIFQIKCFRNYVAVQCAYSTRFGCISWLAQHETCTQLNAMYTSRCTSTSMGSLIAVVYCVYVPGPPGYPSLSATPETSSQINPPISTQTSTQTPKKTRTQHIRNY